MIWSSQNVVGYDLWYTIFLEPDAQPNSIRTVEVDPNSFRTLNEKESPTDWIMHGYIVFRTYYPLVGDPPDYPREMRWEIPAVVPMGVPSGESRDLQLCIRDLPDAKSLMINCPEVLPLM